ncbi:conserved protein of unknown function [Tenacibaculum sp. 190524A02b]
MYFSPKTRTLRELIKILLFFFYFTIISKTALSQNLNLRITSKDSIENIFLKKINFKKRHSSENNLKNELEIVLKQLNHNGFFYPDYKLTKTDSVFSYSFKLNQRIKHVTIYTLNNKKTTFPINQLNSFLKSETEKLDASGNSFSELKLQNINLKKDSLFAYLKITDSKKRFIDRIIIKGYKNFPKSYTKHYLKLDNNTLVSKPKLSILKNKIDKLDFVTSLKKPEILFSKDSTLLYLYLKKKNKNFFDGIINFNSEENSKKIQFNGYINLQLQNLLNTGETLKLNWNSTQNQNTSFSLTTNIPYIFNSPISLKTSFEIFKQDSSFLNTKFKNQFKYNLNTNSNICLTYTQNESNNTLTNQTNINLYSYNSYFVGLGYEYSTPNNQTPIVSPDVFFFKTHSQFGQRTSNKLTTNQLKTSINISYLLTFSQKNHIHLKNESAYLNSKNLLINELFRIGGTNSIRGFRDQSIFTSKYSFANIDYLYSITPTNIIYGFIDYGISNNDQQTSIGLGYKQLIKNTLINIEYSIGKRKLTNFNFNNSFLSIRILNYF